MYIYSERGNTTVETSMHGGPRDTSTIFLAISFTQKVSESGDSMNISIFFQTTGDVIVLPKVD